MSNDFALEFKLLSEAPELNKIFTANVMCCQNILIKYKSIFPNFTDHTSLHSLEVISFCNELVGNNIDNLNCDEIFVLLMAAYLHDSGMGISESDFNEFSAKMPEVKKFQNDHPGISIDEVIRTFHHEFSGKFIEKYQMLFDFPSEEHVLATIQASRGHRKTDLFDENEYPKEIKLNNGNIIHLPYLAALIRLSDELDIAENRNILFLVDINSLTNEDSIIEYKKHQAIKELIFKEDSFKAIVDFSDTSINSNLFEEFKKLNDTLIYCVNVTEKLTPFEIMQKRFDAYSLNTNEAVIFNGEVINKKYIKA